jgi:hypothetical protein
MSAVSLFALEISENNGEQTCLEHHDAPADSVATRPISV